MSSTQLEWEIIEAMIRYGGSFASGLGELWRLADVDNKRKLYAAFPELFAQYREMAQLIRERVGK